MNVGFNAAGLEEGVYIAYINIASNDPDSPNISIPVTLNIVTHVYADLKVFLEGPFNGTTMNTGFSGLSDFPLIQPYQGAPWNYSGTEQLTAVPADVVDWVLIEYRDAPDAASATAVAAVGRQAVLLLENGSVVDLDGLSALQPQISIAQQLFVVVHHRNHLSVISNDPLVMSNGTYQYDFSDSEAKVFGGASGHTALATGIWGMICGDCNADGEIGITDKNCWSAQAGQSKYHGADFNFDKQIINTDKNDFWLPNLGKSSQVPE
jgi:hypothetical protein